PGRSPFATATSRTTRPVTPWRRRGARAADDHRAGDPRDNPRADGRGEKRRPARAIALAGLRVLGAIERMRSRRGAAPDGSYAIRRSLNAVDRRRKVATRCAEI